ncbi:hypothetical protein L1F30_02080 [Simiduia sp. 21SJ11W-1]|uniref:hypothetical protein n=1 Tax=Simiduia sp. 21SJ11W-1 TaxID=2909669 RepID=UPI0020A10EF3|nr:hypothetical protein [Simiduia sp. 21SJ11W-1]UTA48344.1 hypothetical protein L1F30_02080 [Simiduia sp. 21SJ11W-1]
MYQIPAPVHFSPKKINRYDFSADSVQLAGELGERLARAIHRISHEAPFSEEYLLKQIKTDPNTWTNFPCCHGDVAGRWLWAQALAHSDCTEAPKDVLDLAHKAIAHQQADGHFGNETITPGVETMLGAYGNGWMLKGLSVLASLFPGEKLQTAVRQHVQWYIDQYPYWEEVARNIRERDTEYYAVTPSGYFHGLAGLASAYQITQDERILTLAKQFLPNVASLAEADHSHSYLTVRRGCLEFAEYNQDTDLVANIEQELEQVWHEFVMESGGIPERFVKFDGDHVHDDEACSHADWMLLCFKLHKLTGKAQWLERGILCLENQFYYNQTINGGFGARLIYQNRYLQMGKEGYWCCSLYGPSVMLEAASYFVQRHQDTLEILHPIEGTFTFGNQTVSLAWSQDYQQFSVDLSEAPEIKHVCLREPSWASWQVEQSTTTHHFMAQWKFWNATPGRAPEPVKPESGKVYTQFLGPWMLAARAAQNVDIPTLPAQQMAQGEPVEGLEIRAMKGMPQSSKTLMAVAPSDVQINQYDVFSWPNQPGNQIMLYPLKDKESPDNMKTWFKAK